MGTEKSLVQMLEYAKKNKSLLKQLKHIAIKTQQFDLGATIRDFEKELFPETEEQKKAVEKSKELNLLFRMVELNIDESVCWLIAETLNLHNKKKGKFDVKDAVSLMSKRKELFEIETT